MALTQVQDGMLGYDGGSFANRNRIINGDMRVSQRGTSFAGVVMSGSDSPYNLDRWHTGRANVGDTGQCTISQVTGGGIRYETTTADATLTSGSATSLRQIIEGYNCVGLAGNTFTVSFKMKTNKLGTYGVFVYDYTGSSYRTPQSITVTSSGTVESYSLTFPAISAITIDNAARLGLNITLAAESSREGSWYPTGETQVNLFDTVGNYVEVYDVQLEAGSVATPFERRQFGQELALCQRYLPVFSAPASSRFNAGYFYTSTVFYSNFVFQVPTRVTPTGIATTGSFNATYLTAQQATTPTWLGEASTTQAGVYGVVSGVVSAGVGMALAATSGGEVTIQFTGCEL
jgi:hypothetical protein